MPSARFVAVTTLVLVTVRAGSAQPNLPDSTRLAINRVFSAWSTSDGPGCALGVSRNGAMLYSAGYGLANLETDAPLTPGSIFHVASVSKQFTAMAILLLAEDGKLTLDDDIRKYLTEIPDYGQRITIRNLLQHTSGLRDQWDLLAMARGRFDENRITESDVLEIVARQKALNFPPGTEYLYSNTGFTLLGTMVRRVSGKSLRDFAEERIFKPLNMSHTHFHDNYAMVVKGRAAGYTRAGREWQVSLPNYDTYGATSLFTTVGDLLLWEANIAQPKVGSPALFTAMQASGVLTNGDSTWYGYGRSRERYRGAWVLGHSGGDAGYRSWLGQFPEHGLALAVLCNLAQVNPVGLAYGVADVLLADKLAPLNNESVKPLASPTAEQIAPFAGVYEHPLTGAPTFVRQTGQGLALGRVTGPELVPLSNERFKVRGQPTEIVFAPGQATFHSLALPARQDLVWKRHDPAKPTRAELERYTGNYYSEELGATYTVRATDSTLVLNTRWGSDRTVRPAFGDTFFGDYLVSFTRGRRGEVAGMLMSTGRVRRVSFARSAAP